MDDADVFRQSVANLLRTRGHEVIEAANGLDGEFDVLQAAVVKAGQEQMGRLLHAMGDVHPHAPKALLARELSQLTYGRWKQSSGRNKPAAAHGKTLFCNSGFEAVEAALAGSAP